MRAIARWIADHELWVLAILLPSLLLPNPLSPWVMAALPALWLLRWVGRGAITRRTSLDLPILFLLLLVPLGVWASPDPLRSLNVLYLHLAGVALYSGLVNWIAPAYRGPETPPVGAPGRRIVGAAGLLVAGGAALALVSPLLVPTWGKIGINGPLLPEAFAILAPRLPDTIQTNTLGTVMAMLICLAAAWLLAVERGQPGARYRPVRASALAIALVLMGIILVLAWSRGALVALVPALLLVLVLTNRRFLGAAPLVALLGAGLVGWLGPQRILDQLLSSGPAYHGMAATRLEIWDRALRLFADVPYTGAGLGTFGLVVPARYAYVLNAVTDPPQAHAHNIFLQAGSDLGVLGIIALAWLLLTAFVSLARTLRARPGGWQRPIAVGVLGALVVFVLHGQVDCSAWTIKPEIVFWTLLGLVGGLEATHPRSSLWSLVTRRRRLIWAVGGLATLTGLVVVGLSLPAGVSLAYANRGNLALNQAILAASPPPPAALADLQEATTWWGDNQAARLALGRAYERAGQEAAALAAWRDIPGVATAWLVIEGDSAFVQQRYEEAQHRYLLAATLDPASGSAQYGLAEVYRAWGARQPALAAYEQAKTLANFQPGGRGDLAACYFGIGQVYAQDEDWTAAAWQFKAGLDLRPDEAACRALGDIYYRGLKDLAQAEFYLLQAIALRPDRPYAYEQLGDVYLDGGRPAEARVQFETAVALAPADAAAHAGLAQAYLALGRPDPAIREYETAIRLSPNDPWLLIALGDLYRDLGRRAEARAAYEQALAVDPGNQGAQRRIEALP